MALCEQTPQRHFLAMIALCSTLFDFEFAAAAFSTYILANDALFLLENQSVWHTKISLFHLHTLSHHSSSQSAPFTLVSSKLEPLSSTHTTFRMSSLPSPKLPTTPNSRIQLSLCFSLQ
mmetsp:Transcript_4531/g.17137  ORF Transcript_4531/g.17137 Transcript_4531/m.17137 type:complete len:119 (+) Transcript_4531:848-1204(+)